MSAPTFPSHHALVDTSYTICYGMHRQCKTSLLNRSVTNVQLESTPRVATEQPVGDDLPSSTEPAAAGVAAAAAATAPACMPADAVQDGSSTPICKEDAPHSQQQEAVTPKESSDHNKFQERPASAEGLAPPLLPPLAAASVDSQAADARLQPSHLSGNRRRSKRTSRAQGTLEPKNLDITGSGQLPVLDAYLTGKVCVCVRARN